jgi:hypothetical protein
MALPCFLMENNMKKLILSAILVALAGLSAPLNAQYAPAVTQNAPNVPDAAPYAIELVTTKGRSSIFACGASQGHYCYFSIAMVNKQMVQRIILRSQEQVRVHGLDPTKDYYVVAIDAQPPINPDCKALTAQGKFCMAAQVKPDFNK